MNQLQVKSMQLMKMNLPKHIVDNFNHSKAELDSIGSRLKPGHIDLAFNGLRFALVLYDASTFLSAFGPVAFSFYLAAYISSVLLYIRSCPLLASDEDSGVKSKDNIDYLWWCEECRRLTPIDETHCSNCRRCVQGRFGHLMGQLHCVTERNLLGYIGFGVISFVTSLLKMVTEKNVKHGLSLLFNTVATGQLVSLITKGPQSHFPKATPHGRRKFTSGDVVVVIIELVPSHDLCCIVDDKLHIIKLESQYRSYLVRFV